MEVIFNEPVSVTGAPQLALTIGPNARQAGLLRCGEGAPLVGAFFALGFCPERVLVFGYVVQSSDVDADGFTVASTALTLNGGMILDRGGNAATLGISNDATFFLMANQRWNCVNGGGVELRSRFSHWK